MQKSQDGLEQSVDCVGHASWHALNEHKAINTHCADLASKIFDPSRAECLIFPGLLRMSHTTQTCSMVRVQEHHRASSNESTVCKDWKAHLVRLGQSSGRLKSR